MLKVVIIIEKKIKLNHFGYKKDIFNEYQKNYLRSFYFARYLGDADFVYALLYSRGYVHKSDSAYVDSIYITNLTEADKVYSWRKKPKKEKFISFFRYRFDDGSSCVVIITNKKKVKLQNLIKKFKVDFDCTIVYRGISYLDAGQYISNEGIYQYINKEFVELETISLFDNFRG